MPFVTEPSAPAPQTEQVATQIEQAAPQTEKPLEQYDPKQFFSEILGYTDEDELNELSKNVAKMEKRKNFGAPGIKSKEEYYKFLKIESQNQDIEGTMASIIEYKILSEMAIMGYLVGNGGNLSKYREFKDELRKMTEEAFSLKDEDKLNFWNTVIQDALINIA